MSQVVGQSSLLQTVWSIQLHRIAISQCPYTISDGCQTPLGSPDRCQLETWQPLTLWLVSLVLAFSQEPGEVDEPGGPGGHARSKAGRLGSRSDRQARTDRATATAFLSVVCCTSAEPSLGQENLTVMDGTKQFWRGRLDRLNLALGRGRPHGHDSRVDDEDLPCHFSHAA